MIAPLRARYAERPKSFDNLAGGVLGILFPDGGMFSQYARKGLMGLSIEQYYLKQCLAIRVDVHPVSVP